MSLLTLGRRRKAPKAALMPPEKIRGTDNLIAACDIYPEYIHNEYCLPKSSQYRAEAPLNERQMRAVQDFKATLVQSRDDDLAAAKDAE